MRPLTETAAKLHPRGSSFALNILSSELPVSGILQAKIGCAISLSSFDNTPVTTRKEIGMSTRAGHSSTGVYDTQEWMLRIDPAAAFRLVVKFRLHVSMGSRFSAANFDTGSTVHPHCLPQS